MEVERYCPSPQIVTSYPTTTSGKPQASLLRWLACRTVPARAAVCLAFRACAWEPPAVQIYTKGPRIHANQGRRPCCRPAAHSTNRILLFFLPTHCGRSSRCGRRPFRSWACRQMWQPWWGRRHELGGGSGGAQCICLSSERCCCSAALAVGVSDMHKYLTAVEATT